MNMKFLVIGLMTSVAFSAVAAAMDDNAAHIRGATEKKPSPNIQVALHNEERTANITSASHQDEDDNQTEEIKQTHRAYVGENITVRTKFEDTLLELAREHNVGYVALVAANPGVDPFLPGEDREILIPKRTIIPDVPREGIVINLAEMRMYSFLEDANNPTIYPIGIGRDGLNTPLGVTKITRKAEGPSWRPTERMRKENPDLPAVVPAGEDNPLGTHALYLGWPAYLIHGTNKPLGVGRRVSSGCIRMYPEDIVKVFGNVPVGTQVRVIKEPVKLAWIDGTLYLEAHAEDELADSYEEFGKIKEYKVPPTLFSDLEKIAGDKKDQLDWNAIRAALKRRSGMPVPILLEEGKTLLSDGEITEDILKKEPDLPSEPAPKVTRQTRGFNS